MDDVLDLALLDDGIAVPVEAGIQEEIGDVLEPASDIVQRVDALAGAEEPPHDGDFIEAVEGFGEVSIISYELERHLCHGTRARALCPGKDDLAHGACPERLVRLLSESPPYGIDDIALSAPVGACDAGDAVGYGQRRLLGNGFESTYFNPFQFHKVNLSELAGDRKHGCIYVHLSAIIRPAGKPLAFFSGNRQYRDEYLPLSANFRRETWKG